MRVLEQQEKVVADYRDVAIINERINDIAARKVFVVLNATEDNGLGKALGQTFQSSAGQQFSLIQHVYAPEPENERTTIVLAKDAPEIMRKNLDVILKDLDIAPAHLTWVMPGLNNG